MKTLTAYINEKLNISNVITGDINFKDYDNKVLDKKINSLEEFSTTLGEFFGIKPSKIWTTEVVWKYGNGSRDGMYVHDRFYIDFISKDGKTRMSRIRVCQTRSHNFMMQLVVRNYKGDMEETPLCGNSKDTKFGVGDNLYQWLLKIKELTESDEPGIKFKNLMFKFGFIE